MDQILVNSNDNNKLFGLLKVLLIALIVLFLSWYAQYLWKRRRLYKIAAQRKGPLALPLIGSALDFVGSTHDILKSVIRIVRKYEAPVPVWLGQKLFIAVTKPDDFEIILNNPHALEKEELLQHAIPTFGTGLFTAPASKWKRNRKIIMPIFKQKILNGFVEVFSAQSVILLEQLKRESGKGMFNIFHYVGHCTLDIICETALGVSINAQTTDSDFPKWAHRALEIMLLRMFVIWYHFDFIFNMTSLAKDQKDANNNIHHFTGSIVTEKRKEYQKKMRESRELPEAVCDEGLCERETLLLQLIRISEEGANFSDEELREEIDTIMIAGSDSAASMTSFTLMLLGMFPDSQQKVYEEVMDVLGPDRVVESKDLAQLRYTERAVKEAMRLFPLGIIFARKITNDIQLDTCILPAGCSAILCTIELHRNAEIWPDPLKFDPDRFLPEAAANRHPYSWLPFSGGPRNCIGLKYAMMAIVPIIAMIVRKYHLTTDYKSVEDIELKIDLTIKPVHGYRLGIELREEH